jgi:hypothetical protein
MRVCGRSFIKRAAIASASRGAGVEQHDIGYHGLDLGDEVVLRICYPNESDTGLVSQTIGHDIAVQSDATD